MGSAEYFAEDDITVSYAALEKVGQLILSYIQRQSHQLHLDAKGNPLPRGVDLYKSGRLLHTEVQFTIDTAKAFVAVVFAAPYAEKVAERFDFVGICPQLMPEFLAEAEAIIAEGISSGDDGDFVGGMSGELPDVDL